MLLRCRTLAEGPGPYEAVVEIKVEGGTEEVVVHSKSVKGGAIEVGSVLAEKAGYSLVELPRESSSGKWRVWVPKAEILQTA